MSDLRLKKRFWKRWGKVGLLLGVGLLPCPDCGTPLVVHHWPLALLVTVSSIVRSRVDGHRVREKRERIPHDQELD